MRPDNCERKYSLLASGGDVCWAFLTRKLLQFKANSLPHMHSHSNVASRLQITDNHESVRDLDAFRCAQRHHKDQSGHR